MKTVENKLYVLEEEDRLQMVDGNRVNIDRSHVLAIAKAMIDGSIIPPIIVDKETKIIVDGQHR